MEGCSSISNSRTESFVSLFWIIMRVFPITVSLLMSTFTTKRFICYIWHFMLCISIYSISTQGPNIHDKWISRKYHLKWYGGICIPTLITLTDSELLWAIIYLHRYESDFVTELMKYDIFHRIPSTTDRITNLSHRRPWIILFFSRNVLIKRLLLCA